MGAVHMVLPQRNPAFTPRQYPKQKGSVASLLFLIWSGIRGSNSRPIPWQGIALPTELIPQSHHNFVVSNYIRAFEGSKLWRRGPESNRTNRICNPGHNRFATAPEKTILHEKREAFAPLFKIWSGKRVSNSRPQPWQGCALPTELFPHLPKLCIVLRLLR